LKPVAVATAHQHPGGNFTTMARRRLATATSDFGSGKRESHDSASFYGRFSPPVISPDEQVSTPVVTDVLFCGDARDITDAQVADRSVALVVTSPPYFTGKEYETNMAAGHVPASYVEYLEMLRDVLAVCLAKLEPGGRMAVNIANLGRKPYRSLSSDVIAILQDDLGMLLRGEVIWQKARGAGGSCAWGSYRSPQNPVLRDVTERVLIASKGRFDRAMKRSVRQERGLPHEATIDTDEFLEATLDVWEMPAASATRIGHPAPFPVELPRRLIELYTYRDDLVLDPFIGSGTTAVAAIESGRHYVGFDTEQTYLDLAQERIDKVMAPR
jgi:DNA modification methylase